MSASVNKLLLLGNLGGDPAVRTFGSGQTVTEFSVATSSDWKDKQGNKHSETHWHTVKAWGKLGDNCARYLVKGSSVFVEGELRYRSWEDEGGKKHKAAEVVAERVQFLSSPKRGEDDGR